MENIRTKVSESSQPKRDKAPNVEKLANRAHQIYMREIGSSNVPPLGGLELAGWISVVHYLLNEKAETE